MSKFNTQQLPTKTKNLAGGEAYVQSPEMEFISVMLTSFASNQFYQKEDVGFDRVESLLPKIDPEFAAKAIVFGRTKFGMRSISHVAASKLSPFLKGKPWAKAFYSSVIHRPDDITEILSYSKGKMSHAMQKGLAKAFDKFDSYQLAKYKGEGKGFSLVDAVNILHPVPVEKNAEAIKQLIKGELKNTETWEAKLSAAGQTGTEEEKEEAKSEAWKELILSKKIGYFALLKNLRNIIENAPDVLTQAIALLTSEHLIKKSLVLPFRYTTAYEEIAKLSDGKVVREVLMGLNKAVDISTSNVPKFDGETLVVLDESGSMSGKPAQIGALFAAILVRSNNCDLMTFSDHARYRNINPMDSTITIANSIQFNNGGTNFHSIFQVANKKYNRIIILSDMQAWINFHAPTVEFNQYKKQFDCNPFVYSFDLAGYGTLQFPEQNVFAIAGFSDKVFDIMNLLETDKKALINEINKIELGV
jgi:60 kDa SS-A/Ro ribonucleoprotein